VTWADEIIVVDSERADTMENIAKGFTDKVFVQKWEGYSVQKSYTLILVRNDWT